LTFTSPGTNMQRFRERVDNLTFVERKAPARTSNPFTDPESMIDASELLKRIATVKEENLKRLDDDIDILKAYLKTQHTPKEVIEVLEGLTVEQHVGWKKAVDRIKKLLNLCRARTQSRDSDEPGRVGFGKWPLRLYWKARVHLQSTWQLCCRMSWEVCQAQLPCFLWLVYSV
jgi:hypothetical protein